MFSASEQQILRQIENGLRADDRRFCVRFARQQRAMGWARLLVLVWLVAICSIAHMGTVLAEVAEGARLTAADVRSVTLRFRRRDSGGPAGVENAARSA